MTRTSKFLAFSSLFIALGRLTVPGHNLTWPGSYEAFAHLLLGGMIAVGVLKREYRLEAAWLVVALSLFEIAMFKLQTGH